MPAPARPSRLLEGAALLLAAAFAGARLGVPLAPLDNLSNFPVHFAAAFCACAAAFAWRRRFAFAVACLALAALAIAPVAAWYSNPGPAPGDPSRPRVSLLVSNVYYANREHGRILRRIAEEDPDVVGLIEVDDAWLRALGPLRERYPHHFEVSDDERVGLALYSRLPLANPRVPRLPGGPYTPAIAATLAAPDGGVEIVLVHPVPPLDAQLIRRRNEQLAALARYAREGRGPLVMAGDFNVTMWNRGYRPLPAAGLRNAREGRGIAPTWPAIGPFGVPIDHVLATAGVELHDFRVLEGIGSDHLPIRADFSAR
jgi:endonuclease/exonuclease/phosphatase (EEP) superfamily protein YafD